MNRKTVFKYLSGLVLAGFIFGGCTKEVDWEGLVDNLKIDQSLVLPLGEATVTLEDILNELDSIDFINSSGSDIFVEYNDTVTWDIREYKMNLNTVPIEKNMQISPVIFPAPANYTFSFSFPDTLELGINNSPLDQRVDQVRVNAATLKITLNKENLDIIPENVTATLTFPDNRVTFDNPSITSIVHTPTSFGTEVSITLSPFTMFTGNSATYIPINIDLQVKTGNAGALVTPASTVGFKVDIADFDMKVAYGFFQPTISNESQIESVDLGDFQKDLPDGLFRLADPSIKLTVKNNVGMILGVNLDYLKAYRKDEVNYDTVYAQFKNNQRSTKIIINPASTYGSIAITEYTIDKDSGQIHRLFDNKLLANKLDYKFKLTNERTEGIDFIIPKPKIDVNFSIKVPLAFNAGSYVELKDTITNLNLDSILSQDYIDNAILVLNITNGLPIGVDIKLQLLNKVGLIINSTIDSTFSINAAQINSEGLVDRTKLSVQPLQIEINKDQLTQLRATKSLALNIKVERKDNQLFKFEKTNSIAIKAGIFVKGDATFNSDNEDINE
ncbi:MAG: hypothetical protein JXR27_12320 [Paludibacteraceae bacterium]|nr:hypothetical protein [Paludibacteraceae bacterium]